MAESTTNLDLITVAQSQKETTANAMFDAASWAMLFGRRASTTTALTWGYYGGRIVSTLVANGTVALTASTTVYVVAHRTTFAVTASTVITNWNDTTVYGRMYLIVTGATTVTSYQDHRYATGGILVGGGGGGTGTVTSVDASGGVQTIAGTAITTTGTVRGTSLVNAQTGTTYTVVDGDRAKLVTHTNAGAIAVTLPQAGASSLFVSGWYADFANRGAGTVTITPTTSTVDGAASITLTTNQGIRIVSDGTNYFTAGRGRLVAAGAADAVIQVACSDETTAITTGVAKATFRMPHAMTLTAVRASLTTASTSGLPTFDINEAGVTILSTKITIDANEKTSTTAATAPVISDSVLADDAEITIDFDVAGTGAAGVKITLIGTR